MQHTNWTDRKFSRIEDDGLLPNILERLDGTEYRLAGKLAEEEDFDLFGRTGGKWSIMEQLGHLITLEPLWARRVLDIIGGKEIMTEADMSNAATAKGNFNSRQLEGLLDEFGERREVFLDLLRNATPADLEKTSLHPRLKTPMRIVDLAYFVAEHDDHHLAKINAMIWQ